MRAEEGGRREEDEKKRVKSPEAPYQLIEHIILFFLKIIFINGLLVPPPHHFTPHSVRPVKVNIQSQLKDHEFKSKVIITKIMFAGEIA